MNTKLYKKLKIGNVEIDNPLILAPMAGVTDKTFRVICKEMGCGLVYTEMISAMAIVFGNKRTEEMIKLSSKEHPVAVQLFGSDPDIMAKAGLSIERNGADILDINMGCPAPKITKNGEGSALMKKADLAASIVNKVASTVSIPVTVKIRKGWDDDTVNAVDFAVKMESAGASCVAIHGRTSVQQYSGTADWNIIKAVKDAVSIPVIGNGDVRCFDDVLFIMKQTLCDGVMIGRASLGNPWVFKQAVLGLQGDCNIEEPDYNARIDMAISHLLHEVEEKGEKIGTSEMRKHLAWYMKGLYGASEIRDKINQADSVSLLIDLLNEYRVQLQESLVDDL